MSLDLTDNSDLERGLLEKKEEETFDWKWWQWRGPRFCCWSDLKYSDELSAD